MQKGKSRVDLKLRNFLTEPYPALFYIKMETIIKNTNEDLRKLLDESINLNKKLVWEMKLDFYYNSILMVICILLGIYMGVYL